MFGVYLFIASALLQADVRPLPELATFLADFRANLHTDDVLLSQYTYTEKRTHIELGSDGTPGKTQTNVYQITRASDGAIYRKLVSTDGKAVKAAKPEKVRDVSRRDDQKVIDDIFAGYDMRIVGREDFDGRPVTRIHFRPRPKYVSRTRQGRIAHHVAGDAWIDEADHQLARVEAEVIDSVSIGFGLLAKLQKGAMLRGERRKVNEEIWLPARTEVFLSARILLLKGINLREILEYSDYKKFNVETTIKIPQEK